MKAALRTVHETRGTTWPNPAVGCVLVHPGTGDIIATGVTQKGGRPHAEMHALAQAGGAARGAHAYVTLEPCNHTSPGKPCSCAQGLVDAGVTAVIAAMPDPDARMAGQSFDMLRRAGIAVHVGTGFDDAYHSLRGHVTRVRRGRPFITLKLAHSIDGKIGLPGSRVNISAPPSWQRSFVQRGKVDAVMIGINTALSDDPQLTNRLPGATHQPVRIVLDRHGRLQADGRLVRTARDVPTWVLSAAPRPALEAHGVRVIPCAMEIPDILHTLYDAGLGHILCEGGATLAAALSAAGCVDEALMIEGAGHIGNDGIPCPALDGMVLRNTDTIGPDTWRIYDSRTALDDEAAFREESARFIG